MTCSVLGCQCSIPVFLPLQVHEEEDALNVWMYDAVENNGKYTRWQALGQLTTALALLAGLYGLSVLYDAPSRNPAVSRATVQQGRGTLQHGAGHLAARGGAPCLHWCYCPSCVQAPKEYPFENLYLERGGDPGKAPSEAERREKVQSSYGSLTS